MPSASDATLDAFGADETSSVDDFIRELEAKEKDLHITADLTIEIEESEFDPRKIPDDIVPPEDRSPQPVPAAVQPKTASPAAAQAQPGSKTRIYELEQEVESLKKRLSMLREERNDVQEKSDRRLKDFESFKYRMDRERRGAFIDQISNLASQMLPVFDNLDRAIDSVKDLGREKSVDFQQFYDGIVLVNQQMAEIFRDMGVEPIKTVGETFDPNFHEAVAVEEAGEAPPNTILEEMLRGYRIGNRVIRHSMVKVTTGPTTAKAEAPEPLEETAGTVVEETAAAESDPTLPDAIDIDGIRECLPEDE